MAGILTGIADISNSIQNAIFGGLNYKQQEKAMQQQLQLTRETNEQNYRMWQEQRDDARHALEYSVQDAINAGLNPASVAGTSGTASPSPIPAQTPEVKAPQWDIDAMSTFAGISQGVNEMLDVERKKQENEFVKAQISEQNMKNTLFSAQIEDLKNQLKSQIENLNQLIEKTKNENERIKLENEKKRMENKFFEINKMNPATAQPLVLSGAGGVKLPGVNVQGSVSGTPYYMPGGRDGSSAMVDEYVDLSQKIMQGDMKKAKKRVNGRARREGLVK